MPKIVLSKHAKERIAWRQMQMSAIENLINHPDHKSALEDDKYKFQKIIAGRNYQAVATFLPTENKWLVISAWVRGEEDRLPIIWQIISAPFRVLWWIIKTIAQTIFAKTARKN